MIVDVADLNIIRARGETMNVTNSSATNDTVRNVRRNYSLVFPGNKISGNNGCVVVKLGVVSLLLLGLPYSEASAPSMLF